MRTIHEILIEVKRVHLIDILETPKDNRLCGLCYLSEYVANLSTEESDEFIKYLSMSKRRAKNIHVWSTKQNNKSRLKWLDKHIELTKPK